MKTYIYFHINPILYEVFYVGQGTHCKKEKNEKYSRAYDFKHSRSSFWKNIYNKYGIIVVIIETQIDADKIDDLETFYIKQIGRRDTGVGSLVNLTDGGSTTRGWKCPTSTRLKISLGNKGKQKGIKKGPFTEEHKKNISDGKFGVKLSEEHKKNLSLNHSDVSGDKNPYHGFSDEQKFKFHSHPKEQNGRWNKGNAINQFDENGNFIKLWNSASHVERELGYGHSKIINCCKKSKMAFGFLWKYASTPKQYHHNEKRNLPIDKPVYQIKDGILIKKWNSAKEAAESLNINYKVISQACYGHKKTYKGFIWKFEFGDLKITPSDKL